MMWFRRHKHDQPATPSLRAAETRAADLEERADRVADSLLDRLRRNNFAEGIAMSWGQPAARHRRGGA